MFAKLVCEEELDAEIVLGADGMNLCLEECNELNSVFARVRFKSLGEYIILRLTG